LAAQFIAKHDRHPRRAEIVHADRGSSMTSKPVAHPLDVANGNPYSEVQLETSSTARHIQRSVFEGELGAAQLRRFRAAVEAVIDSQYDYVLVYPFPREPPSSARSGCR
jgi:CRISPR/Cas system-associated endoribonuclease Cas2